MPATNVKSKWVGGDLYFYDKDGDEICHIDGTNGAFVPGVVPNVSVVGGAPLLFRIDAAALTGDVDITVSNKIRVIDAWCVATAAGGAGDTITVKNGSTAITDAMDLNVSDKVVVRAGTIDDASHEIAAAGTLRVTGASGATAVAYVLAIRVA